MSDFFCSNHPERPAIETCEVCGKALCGYCLYYTEDGQRLCEQHAMRARENGVRIHPPAQYAEGIIPSQANAKRDQDNLQDLDFLVAKHKRKAFKNPPIYFGNNTDLSAFLSMLLGFITISSCCGAVYCFPFLGILIGLGALISAKDAVDPKRTRWLAFLGLGSSGCLVVLTVLFFGAYVTLITTTMSSFGNMYSTPFVFSTSTITPGPTRTARPPANLGVEPSQLTATAHSADKTATAQPQSGGGQSLSNQQITSTAYAIQAASGTIGGIQMTASAIISELTQTAEADRRNPATPTPNLPPTSTDPETHQERGWAFGAWRTQVMGALVMESAP